MASYIARVVQDGAVTDIETTRRHDGSRDDISGAVDGSLRQDVSYLGSLLGRVLRESGGDELFQAVEDVRAAVIAAYEGADGASLDDAQRLVDALDQGLAEQVARAFTCYFHLSNLAEEHHRVRVLRRRGSEASAAGDSVSATLRQLTEEVGAEEASKRLDALRFHPVLTAHPTEARRRAVASSIRRISDLMTDRDRLENDVAVAEAERRLLEEVDTLWRTSPIRTTRPTPLDEVRTAMSIFD